MEYHDRIQAYESIMKPKNNDNGRHGIISLAELSSWEYPRPQHGDSWGPWRYDAKFGSLDYINPEYGYTVNNPYSVKLNEIETGADLLDWLNQINGKRWGDFITLGALYTAISDLLEV